MHGDFSNITFSPGHNYSTVFDLQGRVGLDANRNEQTAILLHQLRTTMADLVGPHAGPEGDHLGFGIKDLTDNDFTIGAGRYYVDGILVDNPADVAYTAQPHAFIDARGADKLSDPRYLLYLKVWERHITEVEAPSLHEPALGLHHPDSASRAQVVWQVRAKPLGPAEDPEAWLTAQRAPRRVGVLQVRAVADDSALDDPCIAAPDAGYTGENQLYRVEIRSGGRAGEGAGFVWSRDNGSVIQPVRHCEDTKVQVADLGRDRHTTIEPGQWVEVVDDAVSTRRELGLPEPAAPLRKIIDLDIDTRIVTLNAAPAPRGTGTDPSRHPYLRRWDHTPPDDLKSKDGAIPITEGPWIPLEHGIEVRFTPTPDAPAHEYRNGDYWTFPARRTLADVIWPYPEGSSPHGVMYHYAPLALVTDRKTIAALRTSFKVPLDQQV
ncbi:MULTISPECIES: DUF6519 domain-containing protein [unclassified Streptomyces]|uniref:DUF6519 domain-containing protein n=1 Tax=unclassified Streptomyces TaxID=2593676 RepID=UPI00386D6385|nr:DUF6519 domain-containing protein [Streptomyces sp. NBC_00827]